MCSQGYKCCYFCQGKKSGQFFLSKISRAVGRIRERLSWRSIEEISAVILRYLLLEKNFFILPLPLENPRNSLKFDSLAKTILKMPRRNPTWEKFSGTAAPTFRFLKSHVPSQYASYGALILLNSLAFAALPMQFARTSLGAPSLT